MLLTALWTLATAAPCTHVELLATLNAGETAFVGRDKAGVEAAARRAERLVECQPAVLDGADAARIHGLLGLAAFLAREDEAVEGHFEAARSADPDYDFPASALPESHPARLAFVEADPEPADLLVEPPPNTRYYWDGRRDLYRPADRPVILQIDVGMTPVDLGVVLAQGEPLPATPEPVIADPIPLPPPPVTRETTRLDDPTTEAGGRFWVSAVLAGSYGPWNQTYRGWYTLHPDTLEPMESRAWLTRSGGLSPAGSLWLGFAATPTLHLALGAGVHRALLDVDVQKEIAGADATERVGTDTQYAQTGRWAGARVVMDPRSSARPLRPIVSVGALYSAGRAPGDTVQVSFVPDLDGTRGVLLQVVPGGEAALFDGLRLTTGVPLTVALGPGLTQEAQDGAGALQTYSAPPSPSRIGVGLEVGLVLRVGPGAS